MSEYSDVLIQWNGTLVELKGIFISSDFEFDEFCTRLEHVSGNVYHFTDQECSVDDHFDIFMLVQKHKHWVGTYTTYHCPLGLIDIYKDLLSKSDSHRPA